MTVMIRVHEQLPVALAEIQLDVATKIKKMFNLDELVVNGTLSSQVMAHHYLKKGNLNFRINKVGKNKGILEFV